MISGFTGLPLATYFGSAFGDELGQAAVNAGDLNGDGVADFALGAPQPTPGGPGRVEVYNGVTGALFPSGTITGAASFEQLGASVSSAGDLDGDGADDLMIGVRGAGDGEVRVYSGASISMAGGASLLYLLTKGEFTQGFGSRVSGAGDVNLDGTPDMLVKDDFGDTLVFSGASGMELYRIGGSFGGSFLGAPIDGLGDVNGDGCDDYIIGFPTDGPAGTARVFNGCGVAYNYGIGATNVSGTNASIGWSGSLGVAANAFTLTVTAANPATGGIFFYGPNQIDPGLPFFNGFRHVGGQIFRLYPLVVTDGMGDGSYLVDFTSLAPAGTILAGSQWNFQFWYRDGGSANTSDALSVIFAP